MASFGTNSCTAHVRLVSSAMNLQGQRQHIECHRLCLVDKGKLYILLHLTAHSASARFNDSCLRLQQNCCIHADLSLRGHTVHQVHMAKSIGTLPGQGSPFNMVWEKAELRKGGEQGNCAIVQVVEKIVGISKLVNDCRDIHPIFAPACNIGRRGGCMLEACPFAAIENATMFN